MRTAKYLVWWVLVWLILLPAQSATACSPPPPPRFACETKPALLQQPKTCLNGDCTLHVEQRDSDNFVVTLNGEWVGELHSRGIQLDYSPDLWSVDLAEQVCAFEVSSAPAIKALAEDWIPNDGFPFFLEAYSANRQIELDARHRDLFSCWDTVYVKEGQMLASYEQVRPYCRSYPVSMCDGSTTAISATAFFHYLFSNPNEVTKPYLIALVLLMLGTSYFLGSLYRKGELGLFFRPTRVHMWGLVIGIPVFWLCAMTTPVYLGNIMGVYYLLLTITNYVFWIQRETAW